MSRHERRVAGKRLRAHRRHRQGHRQPRLCGRLRAAGHAVRQGPAQHASRMPASGGWTPPRALALPGVRARASPPRDIPQIRFGTAIKDRAMFAADEVRFVGEAVAAVAATTPRSRRGGACARSRSSTSRCPRCSILKRRWRRARRWSMPAGSDYQALPVFDREGNICRPLGDRRRRRRARASPSPIASTSTASRPSTCIPATPSRAPRWQAGTATATSSSGRNTQLPFDMKNMLAEVLDLPASKVRVIVPGIGGGFGGKLQRRRRALRRVAGAQVAAGRSR